MLPVDVHVDRPYIEHSEHSMDPITLDFTRALPKIELHAHLSGSISKECLHEIWSSRRSLGLCLDLEDPETAIRPGGDFVDIVTFFPLFDKYIYNLVSDVDAVVLATKQVIQDFERDGVVYLELRTTPRENPTAGMTKEAYVAAVCNVVGEYKGTTKVHVILSIDRKMSLVQAMEVVDLALKHHNTSGRVIGVDLCGNPSRNDVSILMPAFRRAKSCGLKVTLHFAEVSPLPIETELETLLSWEPDRLGHVINVSDSAKQMIKEKQIGLELCLSCNILAKMTTGGFAMHHFKEWVKTDCPIALSTDDVGVFGSPLSNEYLLAATHFGLDANDLIELSLSAAKAMFADNKEVVNQIMQFKRKMSS